MPNFVHVVSREHGDTGAGGESLLALMYVLIIFAGCRWQ